MSYTTTDILAQLNLTEDSALNELINKLNDYNLVTNDELANIVNISVKPLPNIVRNQADVLKKKMYGVATDEEFGLPVVINRRIVLLQYIVKRLVEFNNRKDNPHEVTANQVGTYAREEILNLLNTEINKLQLQINTLSGNIGDVSIGDLATRLVKVEELLTSDNIDLDTLQEIVDVLENSAEDIENIFIQLASKVDKEEGKSLVDDELIEFTQQEANYNLFDGITMSTGTTDTDGKPISLNILTRVVTNPYVEVSPNKTYSIDTNSNFSIYEVNFFDSNNNTISLNVINKTSHTFTTPSNCYYVVVLFRKDNDIQILPSEVQASAIMVNKSQYRRLNTNDVDFLKEESLKSANLCNFKSIDYSDSTRNLYASGSEWVISGTDTDSHLWIPFEKSLSSGTYTINVCFEGTKELTKAELFVYKTQGEYVTRIPLDCPLSLTFTKTFNSETANAGLFFLYTGTINGTIKFMITKGSTALPYQEYQGDIVHKAELFKQTTLYTGNNETQVSINLEDGDYCVAFSGYKRNVKFTVINGYGSGIGCLEMSNQSGQSLQFYNVEYIDGVVYFYHWYASGGTFYRSTSGILKIIKIG